MRGLPLSANPLISLTTFSGRQLDTMYYVTRRLIPPLARIFNLVGADVQNWFDEMPKSQKIENYSTEGRRYALSVTPQRPGSKIGGKNQKIDIVLASGACITCEGPTMDGTYRVLVNILCLELDSNMRRMS